MNVEPAKSLVISNVVEIISKQYSISLSQARRILYFTDIVSKIEDDETGLYGESALHIYYLFKKEIQVSYLQEV